MAKIAFWITAGPGLEEKALAGLRMAERLKTNQNQDVQVFFAGPAVHLTSNPILEIAETIHRLHELNILPSTCPVNARNAGLNPQLIAEAGFGLRAAGEVLVEWVESGYQVIGI